MPNPGPMIDVDGYTLAHDDGYIIAADEGDPCCCGPGGPPPPPRVRFIRARLCDPSLHDFHPEIPLYIYVPVPGDGTWTCPTPQTPVFKFRFICYRAEFGAYWVNCGFYTPGPGEFCLPDDAVIGGCGADGSWASCDDDRCRKFIQLGRPCPSCPQSGSWCVHSDARVLATLHGPNYPQDCVIMSGFGEAGRGCFEFKSGDPVYDISEIPPGCQPADTGPFESCCVCAADVKGLGSTCLDCISPGWSITLASDTYKLLLCPPQNPTGRRCCCASDAAYHIRQEWVTTQQHTDGSTHYQRDLIDGDVKTGGKVRVRTWSGDTEATATLVTDFEYQTSATCGMWGAFSYLFNPTSDCGTTDNGRTYRADATGDCHNLEFAWQTIGTNQGGVPGENFQQFGEVTISGGGGTGPCLEGCGSGLNRPATLAGILASIAGSTIGSPSRTLGRGCSGCGEDIGL